MPTDGGLMRSVKRADDPGLVLLRSVCHELRPSMSMMSSLVRALDGQPGEPLRKDLARLVAEHVEHAEAVLSEAAAAAQGLATAAPPDQPLGRVLPMVLAAAPAERLSASISPAAAACLVRARPVRQILLNLLSNAFRHGPADGTVSLLAGVRHRRLRLVVADQGRLTPALAGALRRDTPPPGAHGLGLWVVRQLAEADRGSVRARRRLRGVAVEVNLPIFGTEMQPC